MAIMAYMASRQSRPVLLDTALLLLAAAQLYKAAAAAEGSITASSPSIPYTGQSSFPAPTKLLCTAFWGWKFVAV